MINRRAKKPLVGLLGLLLAQCGGAGDREPTSSAKGAIIGGTVVDTPESPVIYLQGSEGSCTAVLVAPRLVATARHCVAGTNPGPFSCTAGGDLIVTGSGTGEIGQDNAPSSLSFFSAARVNQGSVVGADPDAVGVQIISTQTPTACRDDLAFVVLDRAIAGLVPAPIRLDQPTRVGEDVSVWGYGLTAQVDPVALRRNNAQIFGVGPDTPASDTQSAPLRTVRIGSVTCQGDSGGPILSAATGAVIATVSLGSQASSSGPFCNANGQSETVGPRWADYRRVVLDAFAAAGAAPRFEQVGAADTDAGSLADAHAAPLVDAEPEEPALLADSAAPIEPPSYHPTGGSCAIARDGSSRSQGLGDAAVALALTAAAAWRRRA